MAIDRRAFLSLGAAFAAGLAFPAAARAGEGSAGGARFLTAAAEPDGSFAAIVLDEAGRRLAAVPIATRGHDAAADPVARRWVLFARRPGRFAIVVDGDGAPPLLFAPPEDRHFNGHGAFSADGRLLYATENDFAAVRGVLGVYDATDGFRRIGELPTHGVGPHEVILGAAGDTLIVANGGIATDPDYGRGRQPLNLATMAPSLAVIDRASGDLLARTALGDDLHQLSIRHLALDRRGAVWFGCQWEGDPLEHPPLVGRVAGDGPPKLVALPERTLFRARNYVGALAASRDGSLIAASCPRGGALLAFDAETGGLVSESLFEDSSGIAPEADGFLATSGSGAIARLDAGRLTPLRSTGERYDNHLRRLA